MTYIIYEIIDEYIFNKYLNSASNHVTWMLIASYNNELMNVR